MQLYTLSGVVRNPPDRDYQRYGPSHLHTIKLIVNYLSSFALCYYRFQRECADGTATDLTAAYYHVQQ